MQRLSHRQIVFLFAGFVLAGSAKSAELTPQEREFFESRIRPVLVERCYACHNSDGKSEGGLELDWRGGIADSGIVVSGEPNESRLIAILRHDVEGLEMPEDGPKLEDQIIADFGKWIAMGAPDPRDQPPSPDELAAVMSWEATLERRKQWWSFRPIGDIQPPEDRSWSDHPIDRFVYRQHKLNGLTPAKPAEDAVLIRRLYFALIGLPPSPEEYSRWIQQFSEDRSLAIESLVDDLLESPHFGERWARHWMDWIRYAESHGSEGDPMIDNAWRYRDYLIRALNADVPYNQLVREHIAGDMLAEPRVNRELGINESMIGPAHWRMVFHGFAPTDALDEKVRFVDDQINAFSKAFLGLTVSCARCHDHKFDAISQQDYYALFGILASCRPARAVIDLPEAQNRHAQELAALKPKIRKAVADDWLADLKSLRDGLADVEGMAKDADKPEQFLHSLHLIHKDIARGVNVAEAWKRRSDNFRNDRQAAAAFFGAKVTRSWNLADDNDLESWYRFGTAVKRPQSSGDFALLPEGDKAILGIYPTGVFSHGLSTKHAGRITSPDVQLDTDSDLWVQVIGDGAAMTRYVVQDYPRNGTVFPVTNLSNNWRWQRFDLAYWTGDSIHVEVTTAKDAPLLVKPNGRSWFGLRRAVILPKGSPGPGADREYLDPLYGNHVAMPHPESLDEVADRIAGVIEDTIKSWREGTATDTQARLLNRCVTDGVLTNNLDQLPTVQPLVERYRRLESAIQVPTRVPGLDETRGRTQPMFVRGDHKSPGEIVPRRFLQAIDSTPYQGDKSGRLQLADDLVRVDNPLVRRVIVNRIWHHLFGRGIVGTPDNFGRLGQKPTHPRLLDYLATKFGDDGWSLKSTIRSIVLTKTWQLSSNMTTVDAKSDPDNTFLARANVRRLDAEAIRDSLLAASGRLDRTSFGVPVNGNSNRRSVYVQVIRNRLDPFLRAFDFPEPFSSKGRRDVTNVPAQSLMLMNDPAISRYASAWVEQVFRESTQSEDQRLQSMFVTALSREATNEETRQAKQYLQETLQENEKHLREFNAINEQIEHHRDQIRSILEPTRERMLAKIKAEASGVTLNQKPIASWDFSRGRDDTIGSLVGSLASGATLANNSLVVNSGGYMSTAPLDQSLREKTLEAWVRLDNLEQRGGGVMTVQSRNGAMFDSIVFGEKQPRQWMAGSNGFARTESFDAPEESDATKRFVHVAIAYHDDGMVVGYRDGKPYGKPYKSNGPFEFKAGDTIISFGVRHLPAGGNRMLAARISKARLYDRALSAAEIYASATSTPYIDDQKVFAEVGEVNRQRVAMHEHKIVAATRQLKMLGPPPVQASERARWTELARAIFTFKEFIYIR